VFSEFLKSHGIYSLHFPGLETPSVIKSYVESQGKQIAGGDKF